MRAATVTALLFFVGCGEVSLSPPREFTADLTLSRFYRGNLHAHSTRSDGDSPPDEVARWYRDRGYHFVALTDHDTTTRPGEFQYLAAPGSFLVLPGEELSHVAMVPDRGAVPVHLNGLCFGRAVPKLFYPSVLSALQAGVAQISAEPGAVAMVNHPNYRWAIQEEDLRSLSGAPLLEVANMHPYTNSEGDDTHPSVETLWDRLATAGVPYFGVADDDLHDLHRTSRDLGYLPRRGGLGWVQVAAQSLTEHNLCEALATGAFYSSTGVTLSRISARADRLALTIQPGPHGPDAFTTEFIADGGRVVSRQRGLSPEHLLGGDERYVRARVTGPDGARAWTQPYFTRTVDAATPGGG